LGGGETMKLTTKKYEAPTINCDSLAWGLWGKY